MIAFLMIRKTISLFLLFVLFYNCVGFTMTYLVARSVIYHQVRSSWDELEKESKLVVLRFSKQDFDSLKWEKKDEFIWKGDLYDIKEIEKAEDGFVELICYKDSHESDLKQRVNDHEEKHDQHESNIPLKTKLPVFSFDSLLIGSTESGNQSLRIAFIPDYKYLTTISELRIDSPPPEV